MRTRLWTLALVPAVALAVTACSDDAAPTPGPTSTTAAAPTAGDGTASGGGPDEPLSSTPTGAAVADPGAVSIDRRTAAAPAQRVSLTEVSADASSVTVRTEGGAPGFDLGYVDEVVVDGEPVVLEGGAVLQLEVTGADPNGDQGIRPEVAVDLEPEGDGPVLRVAYLRFLDGRVLFTVELDEAVAYSVVPGDDGFTVTFSG